MGQQHFSLLQPVLVTMAEGFNSKSEQSRRCKHGRAADPVRFTFVSVSVKECCRAGLGAIEREPSGQCGVEKSGDEHAGVDARVAVSRLIEIEDRDLAVPEQ